MIIILPSHLKRKPVFQQWESADSLFPQREEPCRPSSPLFALDLSALPVYSNDELRREI
jgi:hypothetical protein